MKAKKNASQPRPRTFRRILRLMEGGRLPYIIGIIGMALAAFVLQVAISYAFRELFDTLEEGVFREVLASIFIYIAAAAVVLMLYPLFSYLAMRTVVLTTGRIRHLTFEKLTRLPMGFFQRRHSADTSSRLTNDVVELEKAYSEHLIQFLVSLVSGIGTGIVMFLLDWRLALFALAGSLLTLFVNTIYAKRLKSVSTKVQRNLATANTKLSNIISGIHIIRVFNIQKRIVAKFKQSNDEVETASQTRISRQALIDSLNNLTSLLSFIGLIMFGAWLVLIGETSVGVIVAVTQLQNGVRELVGMLGTFISNLQGSLAAGERVFEVLDEEEENLIPAGEPRVREKPFALAFDKVSFGYGEEAVIKGMDFSVKKNETAALVGPSGGGKSTVFKLLLQFYEPNEGEIFIAGKNAKEESKKELRARFAYVPQNAHLFNCTIRENIAYGRQDALDEDIIRAAKAANAHDFIKSFSKGYDTMVGEDGMTLSGGQRQRIAIARAILTDAPVLLLDEATSALDNESEALIKDALEKLMKKKTSLIIAHRLSTVEHADNILVIDDGKVAEEGTHADLLAQEDGLYANLYARQLAIESGN